MAQDAMHLLIVRKNKREGGYFVINGNHHYEYLKKHTNKAFAPCLVDESKASANLASLLYRLRRRKSPFDIPYIKPNRMDWASWSIFKSFLKQEPRFRRLSRRQQIRVLRLGLQYRKTTVKSMKAKVDYLLNNS